MELSNYFENQESRELDRIKEEDLSSKQSKAETSIYNNLEEIEDDYERDY